MAPQSLVLSVCHNVYLTKQERYDLHEGKDIEVVGVSIPIWFFKGTTSEPGEEVFCKYFLVNNGNSDSFIHSLENGYHINLPQKPNGYKPNNLSNDTWRKMTPLQKDIWYRANIRPITATNLLDYKDGGNEFLKMNVIEEGDEYPYPIRHYLEIKKMEDLTDSFCN